MNANLGYKDYFDPVDIFRNDYWVIEQKEFQRLLVYGHEHLAKSVVVIITKAGANCYRLVNPDRAEWYLELMKTPDNFDASALKYEEGVNKWYSEITGTNNYSQKFRSKKNALESLKNGDAWFDGNYCNLDEIKSAAESGEMLKVKYWGGTRSGKIRYLSVLSVAGLEGGETDDPYWLAEVLERGEEEPKTYRVDRMQLFKLSPLDFAD